MHNVDVTYGNSSIKVSRARLTLEEIRPCTSVTDLCIENFPEILSSSDLLRFLAIQQGSVSIIRFLGVASKTSFAIFVRLKSSDLCQSFFSALQGKQYSSFGPETCQIFAVSNVVDELGGMMCLGDVRTCPICLDAIDINEAMAAILICNHAFHSDCFAKCQHEVCPVCRYAHGDLASVNHCSDCPSREGLWMCLTCGNIGCSREQWAGDQISIVSNAHALQHFQVSQHPYAQNMETQRVWDYAGDKYIHRLGQNANDRKLVELPGPNQDDEVDEEERKESIFLEYTHHLTIQLAEQREHFSNLLDEIERLQATEIQELVCKKESILQREKELRAECDAKTKEEAALIKELNKLRIETKRTAEALEEEKEIILTLAKTESQLTEKWKHDTEATKVQLVAKQAQIDQLRAEVDAILLQIAE